MNDNDNKNYLRNNFEKMFAKDVNAPYVPDQDHQPDPAYQESDKSASFSPVTESAQSSGICAPEHTTPDLPSDSAISKREQPVTQAEAKLERMLQKIQADEKLLSKKMTLRGGATSYLNDRDFKWLKGDANERAIFWFWVYIRTSSNKKLGLPDNWMTRPNGWDPETHYMYSLFNLPVHTSSSAARSQAIIDFFNHLSIYFSPSEIKFSFDSICQIWFVLNSQIRKLKWIKKGDTEVIEWVWGYLSKRKEIKNNILFWFRFADLHEQYISLMGAIDCWGKQEDMSNAQRVEFIHEKKLFLVKMYNAFKQRERRAGKNKFTLSAKANKELSELAGVLGGKGSKVIEKLIHDEYQKYKRHPENYNNQS